MDLACRRQWVFWDPAGFTKDGNADNFARRRQTELKHGRIAMLATMGYITPEFSKWPGYLSPTLGIKFADVPNGLAAISKVPISGWTQILLWGRTARHLRISLLAPQVLQAISDGRC